MTENNTHQFDQVRFNNKADYQLVAINDLANSQFKVSTKKDNHMAYHYLEVLANDGTYKKAYIRVPKEIVTSPGVYTTRYENKPTHRMKFTIDDPETFNKLDIIRTEAFPHLKDLIYKNSDKGHVLTNTLETTISWERGVYGVNFGKKGVPQKNLTDLYTGGDLVFCVKCVVQDTQKNTAHFGVYLVQYEWTRKEKLGLKVC